MKLFSILCVISLMLISLFPQTITQGRAQSNDIYISGLPLTKAKAINTALLKSSVQGTPLPTVRADVSSTSVTPDTTRCATNVPNWVINPTLTEANGVSAKFIRMDLILYDDNKVIVTEGSVEGTNLSNLFRGCGSDGFNLPARGQLCGAFCLNFAGRKSGFLAMTFYLSTRPDNIIDTCVTAKPVTLQPAPINQGADLSVDNVVSSGGGVFPGNEPKYAFFRSGASANMSSQVYFKIVVRNQGPQTATNVVLTDILPAGHTYRAIVLTQGTSSTPPAGGTGTITCSLGSIPAGLSATVWIFSKLPDHFVANSGNQATVTSATPDPNLDNNTSTERIGFTDEFGTIPALSPKLTITTTPTTQTTNLATRLTYSIKANVTSGDTSLITVAHLLPQGTTFASASATLGEVISTPEVGGKGLVVFGFGAPLPAPKMSTFSVTVNVLESVNAAISDLANNFVIEGGATSKVFANISNVSAGCPQILPLVAPPGGDDSTNQTANPIGVIGGTSIPITWSISQPSGGDPTPAPRLGGLSLIEESTASFTEQATTEVTPQADPCILVGYKLYVGQTANLDTSEANVWKLLPPDTNLTNAPRAPNGSFYAMRAVYLCPNGSKTDSSPSNIVSSGVAPATCALTCTANQTVSATSPSGATVNFAPPAASGTCGTVTCSPAPGSLFPVGTTTVTCTSATGNGRCTFNVTVNAVTGPRITGTQKSGKHLIVFGTGFVDGAKLFVNNEQRKIIERTANSLTGKKAAKGLSAGAPIQVVNPDGTPSNIFNYQP